MTPGDQRELEHAVPAASDALDAAPSPPPAADANFAPEEPADEDETVLRIEDLPREVGWLLVYVGVLGLVVPGIFGAPFLVAGAAVLTPGGPQRMSRWFGRKPPRMVQASMKQMGRFLDDLDKRYPSLPKSGS